MHPTRLDRPVVSVRYLASLLQIRPQPLRDVADRAAALYLPFILVQNKGGRIKHRPIDNPGPELKWVQARIKRRLLDTYDFPTFMCGGVRRRSTRDNAKKHVGKSEVVTVDLQNFFGSVTNHQVAAVWRRDFGASEEVAWLLTRLTTLDGHLPQGAPTSTALANLVLLPTALRLSQECRQRGLSFSVYVDDITLSGRNASETISLVIDETAKAGFSVARDKVVVMPNNALQRVTGHTVNRRLSNGRVILKRARRELVHATVGGGDEMDLQRVRGLVAHLGTTSPAQARWFKKVLAEHAAAG